MKKTKSEIIPIENPQESVEVNLQHTPVVTDIQLLQETNAKILHQIKRTNKILGLMLKAMEISFPEVYRHPEAYYPDDKE